MSAADLALWSLLGAGLATYLMRALPMTVISRLDLPEPLLAWMRQVAESVLAGFVAVILFLDGDGNLVVSWPKVAAMAIALLVYWRSGSVLLSVLSAAVGYGVIIAVV